MRPGRLDRETIAQRLQSLDGWTLADDGGAIRKSFAFRTFRKAFAFMTEVAMVAERMNHHPEWTNVYNRVEVVLTTHDAGGVSELDLELAAAMDKAAA
ncbi:MAG: 4a-hydroxytetrahydrobiopterin dehydratase [Oricola sp.]